MLWACTDWQIDWTAFAAVVALSVWLIDLVRKLRERHAAAKVLAQLILIELQIISAYLQGFSMDLMTDASDEERGEYDYTISERQEIRIQLLNYVERFQALDLRRLAERVDVLPAMLSVSLSLFFSELSAVVQFLKVIGGDRHDGVHYINIPRLRSAVTSTIQYTERAMKDAGKLAKVPLMLKWRMRLRHGKAT